jgi:hypothetical protein
MISLLQRLEYAVDRHQFKMSPCRYSQSCWYFRPSFVNCPSNLLSCSTLPPLPIPCANVNTVYMHTLYKGWGEYGVLGLRQINTCRKVPLQEKNFRLRHFALPSMSLIFLRCSGWLVDSFPSWAVIWSTAASTTRSIQ